MVIEFASFWDWLGVFVIVAFPAAFVADALTLRSNDSE